MSGITVRLARWDQDVDALREIRRRVFIEEQNVPAELEWDSYDPKSQHALALDGNRLPIGCARLLNSGKIGRMAVLAQWRRQGVGSKLLNLMLDTARSQNLPPCWLEAQTHAQAFYRKFGFVSEGEEYLDAGIPHRIMRRQR